MTVPTQTTNSSGAGTTVKGDEPLVITATVHCAVRHRRDCEGVQVSLTQHGPSCDVCNDYILLDRSINPFRIFGVEGLHCHDKCKYLILALDTSKEHFWKALPPGRLRDLADEIHARDCRESR
jgi:hypothetical protein